MHTREPNATQPLVLDLSAVRAGLSELEAIADTLHQEQLAYRATLDAAAAGDRQGYLRVGLARGRDGLTASVAAEVQLREAIARADTTIKLIAGTDTDLELGMKTSHMTVGLFLSLARTSGIKTLHSFVAGISALFSASQTTLVPTAITKNHTSDDPSLLTTYRIGSPTRPSDIVHDNGFLDAFPPRSPDWRDRVSLARWRLMLEGSEALRPDLADANAAYRHFLDGNGTDRRFSYERYVEGDKSGEVTLSTVIADVQGGAEAIYRQALADRPELANEPITFEMTGGQLRAGGDDPRLPYARTENWQKAIGAHSVWTSATVTVLPGDPPQFKMQLRLNAEDRYNFNPGAKDIATGIPDQANGVFEITGLGKQYMNYSDLTRSVDWDGGVNKQEPEVSGEPNTRQRRPPDNRRLRNRL